jgi:hypothetical protein
MSLIKTAISDTNRYEPQNIKPEPNTIYLMARRAGTGVDHLYYLYTNSKGEQFSLSAFPKNDRSASPLATAQNILDGGGNWGPIIRKAGLYVSGSPDYYPSTRLAVYRSPTNDPTEVARDFQLLKREYDKIEGAQIPYRLNGANSNSAAMTAERNWGNSTGITLVGPEYNRTDINVPGAQYDQIIEWTPNTQKSGDKLNFNNQETYRQTSQSLRSLINNGIDDSDITENQSIRVSTLIANARKDLAHLKKEQSNSQQQQIPANHELVSVSANKQQHVPG